MTIYLHIGPSKTGTSTIQEFLAVNRAALEQNGYLLPKSIKARRNHYKVAHYALEETEKPDPRRGTLRTLDRLIAFKAEFETGFLKEAATWAPDSKIIITSEHLSKLHADEVPALKSLFEKTGHDVKVIAYLRPQEELSLSAFSQRIKGGREFDIEAGQGLGGPRHAQFVEFVSMWADCFGKDNIRLGLFQRSQMKDRDLLADFCQFIDMTDISAYVRPVSQNPALDAPGLAFLLKLNAHLPFNSGKRVGTLRKSIVKILEAVATPIKLQLSKEQVEGIRARFAECNETIAREYFDRQDGQLFEYSDKVYSKRVPEVSADRALDLAALLCVTPLPLPDDWQAKDLVSDINS